MKRTARKNAPVMTFVAAVDACASLRGRSRTGKGALTSNHAGKVVSSRSCWRGSLEIDAALRQDPAHAQANRWDYGLGYTDPAGTERALWVEVHSAETSEVSCVLAKYNWIRSFLQHSATDLLQLTNKGDHSAVRPFTWVQSGRYNILANSRQRRELDQSGLGRPVAVLQLP